MFYLKSKKDQITQEPIHKDRAVSIHNKIYDANNLSETIIHSYNNNELATIPHNNEPFTEEMLQNIYDKSDPKSEIIIELIKLLKFNCSKEIQKKLLSLDIEFLNFEFLDIDFLINKYKFLSNDDVLFTEEIIKKEVKNDYRALLFIPDEIMTDEIIKLAIENSVFALECVPKKKKSNEIVKFAVENNSFALFFVPEDKITDDIILLAVEKDSYILKYIPKYKISDEIINLAVQNNGYAIIHNDDIIMEVQ